MEKVYKGIWHEKHHLRCESRAHKITALTYHEILRNMCIKNWHGKSEGFDSSDRPNNLSQMFFRYFLQFNYRKKNTLLGVRNAYVGDELTELFHMVCPI